MSGNVNNSSNSGNSAPGGNSASSADKGWYTNQDPYSKGNEKFFTDFHDENLTSNMTEPDYYYTNKLNNVLYTFMPSDSVILAAFSPKHSQLVEHRFLEDVTTAELLNFDHHRGFARLYSTSSNFAATLNEIQSVHSSVSTMPAMRRSVKLTIHPQVGETKEITKMVTNHFLPRQFLLQLMEEKSVIENSRELLKTWGLKVLLHHKTPGFFTLAVPENKGLFQTLRTFGADEYSQIKFVEPCETAYNEGDYNPGDYWYVNNAQWCINGELTGGVDAEYDFHVFEAWNIESTVYANTGISNAVCAILDTGVYKSSSGGNHAELGGQIVGEQAFGYPDVKDNDGHGTALAGVVVGKAHSTASGKKIVGVAPTGDLYVIKYRNDYSTVALENLYNAIKWVGTGTNITFTNPYNNTTYTYSGLATTNPSKRYVALLCTSYADTFPPSMDNAIIESVDNKVLFICSAGNNGTNVLGSPSLLAPVVLPVGAVDNNGIRHPDSNYGGTVIGAPGVGTRTAANDGTSGAIVTGSSMAAAHIAGEALLIYHRDRADGDWDPLSNFNATNVHVSPKIGFKIRNNLNVVQNPNFLGLADCFAAVSDVP